MIRGLVSNPPLNALARGRMPLTAILRAYDPLLRRTAVDAPAGWGLNPHDTQHSTVSVNRPPGRCDAKGPAVVRVGVCVVGIRGRFGSHRARRGAASQGAAQLQRRLECFLGRRRLARQIAVRSRERYHLKQLPAGFLPYRRLGGTLARRHVIAGRLIALASLIVVTVCVALGRALRVPTARCHSLERYSVQSFSPRLETTTSR